MSRFLPFSLEELEAVGDALPIYPTVETGYLRYVQGKKAVYASMTNVCSDPQGRLADGTYWPASGTHTTITANVAVPVVVPNEPLITTCLRLVNNGTAETVTTANLSVSASKPYNQMLYIYAPTLGGNLTITASNGHSFTVAALTAANSGFVMYNVQANTVAGETVHGLSIAFAGGTASTVYITGAKLAMEWGWTPYFDGSYPDCAWGGTAFLSSSSRTGTGLYWPLTAGDYNSGTIAGLFRTRCASGNLTNKALFQVRNAAGTNYTAYCYNTTASKWSLYCRGSAANGIEGNADTWATGAEQRIVGRWTQGGAGTIDLDHNGTTVTQGAQAETLASGVRLYLGGTTTPSVDNEFGPVILSKSRKTDAWTTAIQANSGYAYRHLGLLWNEYMVPGDVLFPGEKSSVGYKKVR